MAPPQPPPHACHNCRRARLKCDRSVPKCLKCVKRGQECQGYQCLLRWEKGIASRGKMAGLTFKTMMMTAAEDQSRHSKNQMSNKFNSSHSVGPVTFSPLGSLGDPLAKDLSAVSRKYLYYFASHVCRDLVLYDAAKHNPFRELVPLAYRNPVLLQIIIANAALHMYNASHKCLIMGSTKPSLKLSTMRPLKTYKDALAAKQQAFYLLDSIITNISSADLDVTLAVVLLFIEFELLASGQDNWRSHTDGARAIIESLCGAEMSTMAVMSPLRRCLISNCLVFDILGTTLTGQIDVLNNKSFSPSAHSLLQDAEGNHCSSFPATLLELLRTGARLSQPGHPQSLAFGHQHQAISILSAALSFDPVGWAITLQPRSPTTDLPQRTHIASAHRAAVCIYLSRVLLSLSPTSKPPTSLESLVAEVISNLSCIQKDDALFTASTWPAFIAGAETSEYCTQNWVTSRFHDLWDVEPWQSIGGALGVLEDIWQREVATKKEGGYIEDIGDGGDWIGHLRRRGVDWLVV